MAAEAAKNLIVDKPTDVNEKLASAVNAAILQGRKQIKNDNMKLANEGLKAAIGVLEREKIIPEGSLANEKESNEKLDGLIDKIRLNIKRVLDYETAKDRLSNFKEPVGRDESYGANYVPLAPSSNPAAILINPGAK